MGWEWGMYAWMVELISEGHMSASVLSSICGWNTKSVRDHDHTDAEQKRQVNRKYDDLPCSCSFSPATHSDAAHTNPSPSLINTAKPWVKPFLLRQLKLQSSSPHRTCNVIYCHLNEVSHALSFGGASNPNGRFGARNLAPFEPSVSSRLLASFNSSSSSVDITVTRCCLITSQR